MAPRFSMDEFLEMCVETASAFRDFEYKYNPENRLLLETPQMINERFNRELSKIKEKLTLVSHDVYISFSEEGSPSINLGSTLLNLSISFGLDIDVVSESANAMRKKEMFSFEHIFIREYNRCARQFKNYSAELRKAMNAVFVAPGDIRRAMNRLEETHAHALSRRIALGKNHFPKEMLEKTDEEIKRLAFLMRKLERIIAR